MAALQPALSWHVLHHVNESPANWTPHVSCTSAIHPSATLAKTAAALHQAATGLNLEQWYGASANITCAAPIHPLYHAPQVEFKRQTQRYELDLSRWPVLTGIPHRLMLAQSSTRTPGRKNAECTLVCW